MNNHSNHLDDTEEAARTVDGWAATLGFEFCEAQGWVSTAPLKVQSLLREQQAAIDQFRRTLIGNASTLPLMQYPTAEQWEGELPKNWTKALYITQSALRDWAKVHRPGWLRLPSLTTSVPAAVDAGGPQQPAHVEKAPRAGDELGPEPLTRAQIALAFGDVWKSTAEWVIYLKSGVPQWLEPAIVVRAKARSKVGHRWHPVKFAERLRDKQQVDIHLLNKAFRTRDELAPWRDAWQRAQSAFSQFD